MNIQPVLCIKYKEIYMYCNDLCFVVFLSHLSSSCVNLFGVEALQPI